MKRPCIPGGREAGVSTFVPLLDGEQVLRLPAGTHGVVEYRKSGLSLNRSGRFGGRQPLWACVPPAWFFPYGRSLLYHLYFFHGAEHQE
jgi:hypothetical protein